MVRVVGDNVNVNIYPINTAIKMAKNLSLDQILITSTSETYGTAQYVPIDENHPLVGQSPYSASKIAADQLAISYFKSFGLNIKIVRPFNTYGPRQSLRAVIPTIISQILSNKKTIELGNLAPTRDLTFVEDTCRGFITISENASFSTTNSIDSKFIFIFWELIGILLHHNPFDITSLTLLSSSK